MTTVFYTHNTLTTVSHNDLTLIMSGLESLGLQCTLLQQTVVMITPMTTKLSAKLAYICDDWNTSANVMTIGVTD